MRAISAPPYPSPNLSVYIEGAAKRHAVPVDDVLGRTKRRAVAFARFEVMRQLQADGYGPADIGRMLERDHSTVIHGLTTPAPGRWWG